MLGGEPGEHAFYPPTVVAGVDNAMTIAQEEVFGPVVTIVPFEDEKDAIRIANDVKYGLMASVWTGDPAKGHRLASRIKAGTVGINLPYTAFPGLPFGGYKQSGFGRELGIETLDLYLETKSVTVNTGARPINPFGAVARSRYRWTVLAAGTLAQSSFAAIGVGLPAIAPAIRDEFGLSLAQVGAVLSSHWLGTLVTLLPWGFLTDRLGERIVLATGLGACGLLLVVAGQAETFWQLYVLLFLAGAAGASVNSATGRAVMGWFDASQRGFALGIRQAAVPVGGLVGALVLPHFTVHHAYVVPRLLLPARGVRPERSSSANRLPLRSRSSTSSGRSAITASGACARSVASTSWRRCPSSDSSSSTCTTNAAWGRARQPPCSAPSRSSRS